MPEPNVKRDLADAIKAYNSSKRTIEDFRPMMFTIAKAFRQGVGLSGTAIDEALEEAFYQPGWIIVKKSRSGDNRTYTGTTWEACGMMPPTLLHNLDRHDLFVFTDKAEAESLAHILSNHNPVGFVVEEYSRK